MENSNQRASFNLISTQHDQSGNQEMIQQECKRLLVTGQKIEITEMEHNFISFPYLLRLILSLYYSLAKKCEYGATNNEESPYLKSPFTTHIKYSLLKLLTSIIQKKLFVSLDSQKYFDEVSYSLLFKQCLFNLIISLLSENTNFVIVERLINFYRSLLSEQYMLYLPIQVYYLYGGGVFTIEARLFKQKVVQMVQAIGKSLTSSETIINRNIQIFKNHTERKLLLDESIRTVMLTKSKETLAEIAAQITNNIFNGRDYLKKQEFLQQLQSKPLQPLLIVAIQLIRSQLLLLQERSFQTNLLVRGQISKTNFYANQMTKLFNKCPFNGDERCSCKKCQCVRRNRESAKLSQQKKRNAVQQLQHFKKRIEELEDGQKLQKHKILQLQEQNMMLKSLLHGMKQNPNLKSIMMETIEPVSKILDNEL